MKRMGKAILFSIVAMLVWGSVIAEANETLETVYGGVEPERAIIATGIVLVAGVFIFWKRNRKNSKKQEERA